MRHLRLMATVLAMIFTSVTAFADTLVVGNKNEDTVSFIDLVTGEEVRRVETGLSPHEVAISPDGKLAVVVSYMGRGRVGHHLYMFEVETGAYRGVVDLGRHTAPHGLKWIAGTRQVAVTTEGSRHLLIVDIDSQTIIHAIKTGQGGSHMVALAPDGERAYVGNINAGSVSVIDLRSAKRLKNIKAGSGTEAVTVTPDGKELWVGNNNSRSVMIFDTDSHKRLATLQTGGIPIRVEVSPDGRVVAVSEADLNRVSIYSTDSRERIARIDLSPLGGVVPVTLLFSPDGTKLWAAATRAARIIEIDAETWEPIRALEAGRGSDGLGYSPLAAIADPAKK